MIPVKADDDSVGLIILAAGESKRMGSPKQLLPYHGTNLLQHTLNAAINSKCDPVVLVLGAHSELIRPLVMHNPIHIVENKEWQEGMASSIKKGLEKLQELKPRILSMIVMLSDQPLVSANHINKLVEASHISHKSIVISEYEKAEGAPVLFNKVHFQELKLLKGKEGAKKLFKNHKDCVYKVPFPEGAIDIDTPEDYQKVTEHQ